MLSGWNWFVDPGGPENKIWLTWDNSEITVDILATHEQYIHCRVHLLCSHICSLVTIVYGVNDVYPRRVLWNQLVDLLDGVGDDPWIVLGDFNTVLDTSEICGLASDSHTAMDDFATFLNDTGLVVLPARGAIFTWHNCSDGVRSLWKKLDRMLVNDRWLLLWPNTTCFNATPRTSNHSPLVLHGAASRKDGRCFRFDNYLAKSPGFIDLVRSVWEHPIVGTPMYSITRKVKALKLKFRAKRKEKGDLTANVIQAKGFLDTIQRLMETDHSNDLLILLERMARLVLLKATLLEHRRRAAQKIFQITSDSGARISDEPGVAGEFVRFYTSLLGGQSRHHHINLMFLQAWARYVIPTEEGEAMTRPIIREEVKEAFFDIAEDKAPGPDGYSAGFFKAAWSVIGDELTAAIQDFFVSAITKIIVQRMSGFMDKLVSPPQNAFVPGRRISNNILLGQELFHGYNRQHLPPRCALKVDLRKAYDTLEWDFVEAMLYVWIFWKIYTMDYGVYQYYSFLGLIEWGIARVFPGSKGSSGG
ncbi:UNVERIFIED_CONTAM: hypothetical protein Slati_2207200 [Sesamum latifolium]|uniref:Reverse transcriptase domain-containing protein n=1 Tax=Sesamum latifolium TaxID=2727402 RepID=A0AAW2WTT6_9LAMI